MLSERFVVGMKLVLGLLPICYGGMLIVALPNTWQWLIFMAVALIALLVLCITLDYPLQTIWPVFPGAFLVLACSFALYQGALDEFPLTRQPTELIAVYLVAALYLIWGARATWKVYGSYS
jgi:hypothetical protein